MGRKATGTVRLLSDGHGGRQWHARFTRANGERSKEWEPLDPQIKPDDRAGAQALAARMALKVTRVSAGRPAGESVAEYADRWCEWREGRGLGCVRDDRILLRLHLLPLIGHLDVRAVTRDELKGLVKELDAKARRGETVDAEGRSRSFSAKTAVNAWVVVRAMFRDARRAKDPALCVREDNPADDVAPPDMGSHKAKTYLWPSEFLALITCERVPLRWRRLFALATYTYARAGELAALEWSDVDLEHGTIHIHRSLDSRRGSASTKATKATKSDTARRVRIEPALAPLLASLHRMAGGTGRVIRKPGDGASAKLRTYLMRAGITRADLFVTDATRRAITFHDLRATGITWCAVRGDDPLKIMQRAGHADFETTKIYLREAENLSQGFGSPFPTLPEDLQNIAPTNGGESPTKEADPASSTETELHGLATPGDASKPLAADRGAEPTDAELERAIVGAVMAQALDVARLLAAQLDDRRRARMPANVVDFAAARRGR